MSDYPEHDKVAAVKAETEVAGEFFEWLLTTEYQLCVPYEGDETDQQFMPAWPAVTDLLARWKGVNLARFEAENLQILAEIRAGNEESPV